MFVTPGIEGLLEDEITIGVKGNHDILVAQTGLDREPSSVIRVEKTQMWTLLEGRSDAWGAIAGRGGTCSGAGDRGSADRMFWRCWVR